MLTRSHGSPYHYIPTKSIAVTFVSLYSLSTIIHIGQAVHARMWWLFPTVCFAGFLEVAGWGARLWSSFRPESMTPFELQITATIIGPTPLVAANFIILSRIIERLGPSFSRLKPKLYAYLFCSCDIISLVVQAAGGVVASRAVSHDGDPTTGGHIMLGGIIFQMITISVYVCCALEFVIRYCGDKPIRREGTTLSGLRRGILDMRLRLLLTALAFSTVFLFIRAVYRTIELTDGWSGRIISTEKYFNILDGGMITLAIFTFNFAHPSYLLRPDPHGLQEKGSQSTEYMTQV